ncbi:PHD domain-containing protein [Rhizoctonia solani AG-1 IA]|uniref:PHD domain-containing protein n=1 Tax=Thanatephorus cucumeris (strain AG1-IA) TaxID=983506 RepID=L8WXA7_THACA|nr:PHD domain-containing protein [Rhizoctonia solani AG-1 IA]
MSYNPRDDYEDSEDEVTRCVCGSGVYVEEVGDFMIQCEQCYVWQHGLCVGLMRVEDSPEHYYCEKCRPENHAALLSMVTTITIHDQIRDLTILHLVDFYPLVLH